MFMYMVCMRIYASVYMHSQVCAPSRVYVSVCICTLSISAYVYIPLFMPECMYVLLLTYRARMGM